MDAVVFDLDGLIFNTEEIYQEVGRQVLARRGKTFDGPLLDQMMGRPPQVALQLMIDWHRLDVTVDELARESEAEFMSLLASRLAPMPGLVELVDALDAARIPKAIATSSTRGFAVHALERYDLLRRFQFVLTCEDIVEGKPHPEIYLKAAERLRLAPDRMMVLEDSHNGCRAAVAAGALAVAVPAGHSQTHSFPGARLVADTLRDRRIYELLGLARP